MQKGIIESFEGWQMMLEAARANPAIAQYLSQLGCTADQMTEGIALMVSAKGQHQKHQQTIGDHCRATDALKLAQQTANITYLFYLKVARLTIPKDQELWHILKLHGDREESFNGWFVQVENFYANLPEAMLYLNSYGFNADNIEQAKTQIQAVLDARESQTQCEVEMQLSKQQLDKTLEKLDEWMGHFICTIENIHAEDSHQPDSSGHGNVMMENLFTGLLT